MCSFNRSQCTYGNVLTDILGESTRIVFGGTLAPVPNPLDLYIKEPYQVTHPQGSTAVSETCETDDELSPHAGCGREDHRVGSGHGVG